VLDLLASYQEWSQSIGPVPEPALPEFGRYQCDAVLGSGGMGTVYRAHRSDGQFSQEVALKVLRWSMRSEWGRHRFRTEREILARLNHPGIARLLDGGTTTDGEPYLVMELVDGEHLDAYCSARALPRTGRLRLIRQVLESIDYAHRNLVVHRDIKPANILVTADGSVKLLDFGVSKLTDDGPDTTALPAVTPAYASPEQLRGDPVTTASDIYSLGVVLYELLAGHSPFGMTGSWALALWRAAGNAEIAEPPGLPGDLWAIVSKALEADPSARYLSARQMADDIGRFLEGRPVQARPATIWSRFSKFVRRNRLAVSAAAAVAVAVVVGTTATLWQARRAQARFEELRSYARYVVTDLHAGLQRLPGSTQLQRESVEQSLKYMDRLAGDGASDESLRLEVADGYRRLGDVLGNPYRPNLGDRKRAESVYQGALRLARSGPQSDASRRIEAEITVQLAATSSFGGEKGASLQAIRRSADTLVDLAAKHPQDRELALSAARAWEALGVRLSGSGGNIETISQGDARSAHVRSASLAEGILKQHPGDVAAMEQAARAELNQGLLLGSALPAEAMAHYEKALATLDRLPGGSARADVRRLRANVLSNIGWAEGQAGSHAEAVAHLEESARVLESLYSADPANTNAAYALTGAYRAIGIVETYRNRHSPAAAQFTRAAEQHRLLLTKDPGNKVYTFLRAENLIRAGNALAALGERVSARTTAAQGLETVRSLASAPEPQLTHVFAACRWLTETSVLELRRPLDAALYCRKAMAGTNRRDPDAFAGLAHALELGGDRPGAIGAMREAIALIPPSPPGAPVSRQRQEMESYLAKLVRGGR
jgi:tetratricopeptide (TPR) repeat protein